MAAIPLYRPHSQAPRTRYTELTLSARALGELLRGTPGGIFKRNGTGHDYSYRVFYPVPGRQAEEFVGRTGDKEAIRRMQVRIVAAQRMLEQVRKLRHSGYQIADRTVASVLTELHNSGLFRAGLIVVGTLAYMGWLNEHGARITTTSKTPDVDVARNGRLSIDPVSLVESLEQSHVQATPGRGPRGIHTITVGMPGKVGLRVDVLASGDKPGAVVPIPELKWQAQMMPHYDYLLEDSREAAVLAGGQCIPVRLPSPERVVWHKLFSSADSGRVADKKLKDLRQAATLAAVIVEQKRDALKRSFAHAPAALRAATLAQRPRIEELLSGHPKAWAVFASLRK